MKKATKLICMLMVLILSLTMFSGCASKLGDDEMPLDLTIGIPVSAQDEAFANWQSHLAYWKEDFATFYNINISYVTVPTEAAEAKKFMKKVENGDVAMFFAPRGDMIDAMIEKETIISYDGIRATYPTYKEEAPGSLLNLSAEDNLSNYMMPYAGTYQGLYINSELFAANEIAEPTDWASLLAAITALKEKGITPIAAGFADHGLEYMVDEMVLSEGGTAEHSYQPTFGIMSSWERAVKSIKSLEKAGAFTANCYNVTYADALQSFINGTAAMIVAPSADIAPNVDANKTKAIAFPATPTGKREKGAFIGDFNFGIYISTEYFQRSNTRYNEAVIELLGDDYMGAPEVAQLMASYTGICGVEGYYDSVGYTLLDESYNDLIANGTAGDRPMRMSAYSVDTTVDGFRKALTGSNVTEALKAATDAEIAAKAAAEGK